MSFVFFSFCLLNFPPPLFQLEGKIVAPTKDSWAGNNKRSLISIINVKQLTLDGSGGFIDGCGSSWWPCKTCSRPSVTTLNFLLPQNHESRYLIEFFYLVSTKY